mmetsp:Transcript_84612/g.244542  ORF Transcript_84612/g.244542 Transcript_84612/m.244542 type:complete len:427 (-) Transcript_84612:219-1499(-)
MPRADADGVVMQSSSANCIELGVSPSSGASASPKSAIESPSEEPASHCGFNHCSGAEKMTADSRCDSSTMGFGQKVALDGPFTLGESRTRRGEQATDTDGVAVVVGVSLPKCAASSPRPGCGGGGCGNLSKRSTLGSGAGTGCDQDIDAAAGTGVVSGTKDSLSPNNARTSSAAARNCAVAAITVVSIAAWVLLSSLRQMRLSNSASTSSEAMRRAASSACARSSPVPLDASAARCSAMAARASASSAALERRPTSARNPSISRINRSCVSKVRARNAPAISNSSTPNRCASGNMARIALKSCSSTDCAKCLRASSLVAKQGAGVPSELCFGGSACSASLPTFVWVVSGWACFRVGRPLADGARAGLEAAAGGVLGPAGSNDTLWHLARSNEGPHRSSMRGAGATTLIATAGRTKIPTRPCFSQVK